MINSWSSAGVHPKVRPEGTDPATRGNPLNKLNYHHWPELVGHHGHLEAFNEKLDFQKAPIIALSIIDGGPHGMKKGEDQVGARSIGLPCMWVCDGHRGKRAAEFVSGNVGKEFGEMMLRNPRPTYGEALADLPRLLDRRVFEEVYNGTGKERESGTTFSFVTFHKGYVLAAVVGDSKVMFHPGGEHNANRVYVTRDHEIDETELGLLRSVYATRPLSIRRLGESVLDERAPVFPDEDDTGSWPTKKKDMVSVYGYGGYGEPRMRDYDPVHGYPEVLNMIRSIGDFKSKPAVHCTPDLYAWKVEGPGAYVLVASDGLWGKGEDIPRITAIHKSIMKTKRTQKAAQDIVRAIVQKLNPQQSKEDAADDVSAALAFL